MLPINRNDPPLKIKLWVSAFRRWCRNCPAELKLTYSDGQLHVLMADTDGKMVDDELHRLGSAKVPWFDGK